MIAAMLTQVPLPLLPGDAAEVAPGVGLTAGPDGGGVVWVHGLATFTWDSGDEAARRLAAVQLVQLRAATQKQVAAAFGTDPVTVWRWDRALRESGVAGLIPVGSPEPSGLRTSSRVHPERVGCKWPARKRISRLNSATRLPERLWITHGPLPRWRAESA